MLVNKLFSVLYCKDKWNILYIYETIKIIGFILFGITFLYKIRMKKQASLLG